jgi:hypothetical protein
MNECGHTNGRQHATYFSSLLRLIERDVDLADSALLSDGVGVLGGDVRVAAVTRSVAVVLSSTRRVD